MLVSIKRSFPKPFLAFVLGSVSAAAAAQGTAPVVVPYTVTTVAGDTQSPVASLYAGNGSGAAGLPVNLPVGVAIDASHNLYIADGGNNLIWQVTAAGVSNILAGKAPSIGCVGTTCGVNRGDTGNAGPAGSAQIDLPLENDNPGQVAVDSNGNVYFVESSQRVRVLYNGGATMAAFLKSIYPTSTIAAGNVYTIAGNGNYGWLDGPALSAQFHQPAGLAVDASGNVYIGSNRDNAVRVLNTQTSAITVFGTTIQPGYIGTVIGTGCVANGNSGTCEYAALTNNLAAASTVINWAEGIWLDSYGNLFVASFANTSTTTYKGIAVAYNGGTGNPMTALLATLNGSAPTVGHVYLLAGKGSKNINTIANYASLGSSLYVNGVRGVATDPSGNVYYTDTNYNAVYRIDAVTGLVSLIAGGGTYKSTTSAASPAYCSGTGGPQTTTPDGDGCAQSAVNLNQPSGIASDTSGNLYIVDSGNNSIRRISSGLSFPTVDVGQSAAQNLLIHFYANNLPATGSPFAIGSGPFALSGTPTCTSNADSSKDCVVTIVFTPTATGTAAGTLQATGTGGATTSFQLAGTGSSTASTTTLSVSAYQTAPGNSITYTATVTGGATTPAGTVNFYQNGAPLGAGSLNGSGVATYTANGLAAGVYQVYAAYSPSGIYSASNSNTQVIAVAAASGADFTMTVPTYNWSQVAQGGASSMVLATLTNSTGATVGPMTITGSNAALAFSNSTCGVGMLPGAVCTFDVELEPSLTYATGSYTGTITAASGSYTSNPGLTMTGTVLPAGFVFAPASISSGSQLLNMTGSATTVSLTNNTGTAFSSSNPIAIQAPAGFTVSANTCSGTVASNGGSCTFNVTFTPSAATAYSANLTATGGSYSNAMPLSGTGVTPSIVTSPASYSWPLPTAQGGQSTVQTMTITNNTGSTLAVPSITPGTGLAIGSNTCTAPLAWNSSCSFTVQLAPSLTYSVGPYSGTVTVSSGSYHSSISFSGNVIVAGFVFSPASIAFGSQFLTASWGLRDCHGSEQYRHHLRFWNVAGDRGTAGLHDERQ